MERHECNFFYEDEDGWWPLECSCGAKLGVAPDPETAVDILMDHANQAGYNQGVEHGTALLKKATT